MTNDLFRDLLDGRHPLPTRRERFRQEVVARASMPWPESLATAFIRFADAFEFTATQIQLLGQALEATDPPADPRARALWAKQHQGNGPQPEAMRVRGRNNKYQTKG